MKRLSLLPIIGVLALTLALPSAALAAPQRDGLLSGIPVTGTLSDGGTFTGNLTITEITRTAGGALQFTGNLTGIATDAGGTVTEITQDFTAVIGSLTGGGQGKCDILFLDLGPIFLDVLGLQVDLSRITLDVDAVPGPGNLLGNLLCAVAGLLDNPNAGLDALLRLINRLLG